MSRKLDGTGVVVIIPTYNEVRSIADIVARLHSVLPSVHILTVDDSSPDGTGDLMTKMAAADSRIHVIHRSHKMGFGSAYVAGFLWALSSNYDMVVQMDADGSRLPEQLPILLNAVSAVDIVIGSRWVSGGKLENWPLFRRFLSWGGSAYARALSGIKIHDLTGGYRVYRATALRALAPEQVRSRGYSIQIELAFAAHKLGLRLAEVPITFVQRTEGSSKMSVRDFFESLRLATGLWLRSRRTV